MGPCTSVDPVFLSFLPKTLTLPLVFPEIFERGFIIGLKTSVGKLSNIKSASIFLVPSNGYVASNLKV